MADGPKLDSPRLGSRVSLSPELLLLSSVLIFSPLIQGGTTHQAVMIIRLMILLLLSVYLVRELWEGELRCPPLRIGSALLAFLGITAISVATSPYTNQSLQWFLVVLSYAGLLYLLVCFLREWDHIAKLLAVLTGMGLFEASWTIVQAWWLGTARPSGTFFNPNFLAGYLAAISALVLGYLCYTRGNSKGRLEARWACGKPLIRRIGAFAVLGVLLLALVYTSSRGGMVALLAGTSLVVGARYGLRGSAVLVLLVLAMLVVPNPLRDRLRVEHVSNPVGYARWEMWQSAARAMADHPLGVGPGLYQYVSPRYAFPVEGQIARYRTIAEKAHNEYLQMGVEFGVASIPIFFWGVVGVALEAATVLRQRLRRWQRGVVVGASGGAAGILVHAAVDSNLHAPALAILLTLCVSIILSARRLCGQATEPWRAVPLRSRSSWWIWAGAAVVAVAMLTVTVTRLGLAWAAYETGARAAVSRDYPRAIADYERAIALDPGKALYHSSMAIANYKAFTRTGKIELARVSITELDTAIAQNPLDGRLSAWKGRVYQSLSSSTAMSRSLGKAWPEQRADWQRAARAAFERATDLEPFNPFYLLDLARTYLALGMRESAQTTIQRAVHLEPNFLPGRELLARLYLGSKQIEEAEREHREIIDRQQRYANRTKGVTEKAFLQADVTGLEAALDQGRLDT